MKGILKKALIFAGGLLATFGIGISQVPAHVNTTLQCDKIQVSESTPLYLEHATQIFSSESNTMLSQHYSHASHESHASHASHYSSRY